MKKLNLIFVLFLLVACAENRQLSGESITVDITKSYPSKEIILQDFMEVEYIPLETTNEFLCQGIVRDISENLLIVTNQKSSDGNIFIYSRNGKALRIINRRGQGGEEYNTISSIVLNEDRNELFVSDPYSHAIVIYDLEGNFKRRLVTDKNRIFYHVYDFDQEHLIVYDSFNDNTAGVHDVQSFMLIDKQDGHIVKEIQIPFKEKKSVVTQFTDESGMTYAFMPNNFYPIIPCLDTYVLLEASADTLYRYSSVCKAEPFIVRVPSIQTMNPEGFLFPLMLTKRYCFMETFIKGKGYQDLVFDKQKSTCFQYQVYNNDYTTEKEVSFKRKPLNREIPAYQPLEAPELVSDYQKNYLKGELKEIVSRLNEDDNPVIMLIKHKK